MIDLFIRGIWLVCMAVFLQAGILVGLVVHAVIVGYLIGIDLGAAICSGKWTGGKWSRFK